MVGHRLLLQTATFDGATSRFDEDKLTVPPGHTSSNVCYLYRSPHGKRYLFVGDTLYLDRGQWKTLVVSADGGNRGELNASLRFLRQFDVDEVICSVSVGEAEVAEITPEQWHDLLDSLLEQAD